MKRNLKSGLIALIWILCFVACSARKDSGFSSRKPILPDSVIQEWQIQFTGELDLSVRAGLFDLDLFDTSSEQVEKLQQDGKMVVCYINAGAWEKWRPDKDQFPSLVLGNEYSGWVGERWLDVRQMDLLFEILRERIALCEHKGFDGVEFDNVDGYMNNSGFPISYQDQLEFNIWLAETAHQYGLSAGLKNDPDQILDLEPYFDFAIVESCFSQDWCSALMPFINAGKPVYAIEYIRDVNKKVLFCQESQDQGISLIIKREDLGLFRETCSEVLFGK